MNRKRVLIGALVAVLLTLSVVGVAQIARPYHNGSVWNVAYIRMKPGMDAWYLNYLATDWKRNQEALKAKGLILSYKVLTTEAHGSNDFNVMLMTEYKDLATMEANQAEAEKVGQEVVGDDKKQQEGYRERLEYREVLQNRLAREIILSPKP